MSAQTEATLRAAARYIEAHGWVKRTSVKDGRVCMAWAISRVANRPVYSFVARLAVERMVNVNITEFNDRHCKTADDAIAALEIAADLEAP